MPAVTCGADGRPVAGNDRDMIERERIDERRMREKYEWALERIANGRNGVKPLEDFEAQEIAQDALRRV